MLKTDRLPALFGVRAVARFLGGWSLEILSALASNWGKVVIASPPSSSSSFLVATFAGISIDLNDGLVDGVVDADALVVVVS